MHATSYCNNKGPVINGGLLSRLYLRQVLSIINLLRKSNYLRYRAETKVVLSPTLVILQIIHKMMTEGSKLNYTCFGE